ncbi:MAG: amidohydrolase [Nitrososphaeria archaeon]
MGNSLFKVKYVVTCNESFQILHDAAIAVEDGVITYVGDKDKVPYSLGNFDYVFDIKGGVLIPGLVNCHVHAAMTLFKGVADDLPLKRWLEEVIWPLEDKLDSKSLIYGNYVAIMEMLSSGTTTFADFYFFDELIEAVKVIPIRTVATLPLLDKLPNSEKFWSRLKNVKSYEHKISEVPGGLISLALGPHAIYSCSEQLLREVLMVSDKYSIPVHMHVSETKYEFDLVKKEYGLSPVKYLDRLGLLNKRLFAAHCVYLDEGDVQLLSDRKVSCVHNPSSNLKLASGIMPLYDLLKKGVNVCLGTDGSASSNSLNLLSEMRLTVLLHRGVRLDPSFPTAKDALLMATLNGAKALGLDDKIGSIEVGKRADFVILDGRSLHLLPENNIVSNIVYSSSPSDVSYSVVDGRVLFENGKFVGLDSENVLSLFNELAVSIWKSRGG